MADDKVPMSEWIAHPPNDNYLRRSAMWEDELPGYDPDAPEDPDDADADDIDDDDDADADPPVTAAG